MKIKIINDVFNIAKRIKYIDKEYFILWDSEKNNFEIHNENQIDTTYCLTLPFKDLDKRALDYVYQTQSTNIEKILENIENDNKLLESAENTSVLSQFNDVLEDDLSRR